MTNKSRFFRLIPTVILIFLTIQVTSLQAIDEERKEHERSPSSHVLPSSSSKLDFIKRLYDHKEELERTKTYLALSVAHTGVSLFCAPDDIAYRCMYAVLGASHTIKPWLPSNVQTPFGTVLKGVGWLLEASRLCFFPKRYVCEQVLGCSALLFMDLAMSSDTLGPYQKELEALAYYTSKMAGCYGDELTTHGYDLFSNGWGFFRENLCWSQEQQCDPLGDDLCFYSNDSDDNPILPIVYNITNAWKAVAVCSQGNKTQNDICGSNYLENLPNYAYDEIYEDLYKSIKFLGNGAENRVYKVELNHSYYNTTHIALRAWVKSVYGHDKNSIPSYLSMRFRIKRLSTESLNINDFFPEVFSVYFSSLPGDVKKINLYEGTDVNKSIIPDSLYKNHFFRGLQTGPLHKDVFVRYVPINEKHMGWEMPILPTLYTEMKLMDGGSLASLSKIPHETVVETCFIDYALSIKNLGNKDGRLANVGIKTVSYLRAYHKGDQIYLMRGKNMPNILDWDYIETVQRPRYFFQGTSEGIHYAKKHLSEELGRFIDSIQEKGLFSKKTQSFLKKYLITEKDIREQELEGAKIKHYHLE